MTRKLIAIGAAVACLSATTATAQDLSIDGWLGAIGFEDDVDVDALTAQAFGGTLFGEYALASGMTVVGALTVEANAGDFGDDDDHTHGYAELAAIVLGEQYFGYGAWGASEDTGDADTPAYYGYLGIGGIYEVGGFDVVVQAGGLRSDDYYDETINSGVFVGFDGTMDLGGGWGATVGMTGLFGERFNGDVGGDGTIRLAEYRLGVSYVPAGSAVSYFADFSNASYSVTEEQNSPYVNELRVGLSYTFGGGTSAASRVDLPNVGRWVSVSANEIE